MTTQTPVAFTVMSLNKMPSRSRGKSTTTSRYAVAIDAAAKYKRKGVVLDVTGLPAKTIAVNTASIVSAIKSRGLAKTLKVSKRENQLWIHRAI